MDRKESAVQLLQVLYRVMEKRIQIIQMGAVTAAVAQAIRLAQLGHWVCQLFLLPVPSSYSGALS